MRAWQFDRKIYPSILLEKTTSAGVFSISEVDSQVKTKFEPLELLCLSLAKEMKKVTRIEIAAVSGTSLEISQDNLEVLEKYGFLDQVEYDEENLRKNLERLNDSLGEDWFSPVVERIASRKIIKQYILTKDGEEAESNRIKKIRLPINLHLVITTDPFFVFPDKIRLKMHSFDTLTMSPDLISQILEVLSSRADDLIPQAVSPRSVAEGKEVQNTKFMISVQTNGSLNFEEGKKHVFLGSNAFDRWANPNWKDDLYGSVPKIGDIRELLIKSMASSYEMVEDVLEEGLQFTNQNSMWTLAADLEMLMLINRVHPVLIKDVSPQIKLKITDTKWLVVLLLKLTAFDDLAQNGLNAARFHANASRKGFNLEKGFDDWKRISSKSEETSKREDYIRILEILVKYQCLDEIKPEIDALKVDLESLLGYQRRESQSWEYSRIRQVLSLIEKAGISNFTLHSSEKILGRIDEEDALEALINEGILYIYDESGTEPDTALNLAKNENCHYLGNEKIPDTKEFKELRIYSKNLRYFMKGKNVTIPKLNPFYEFRVSNVLEKMYREYYE